MSERIKCENCNTSLLPKSLARHQASKVCDERARFWNKNHPQWRITPSKVGAVYTHCDSCGSYERKSMMKRHQKTNCCKANTERRRKREQLMQSKSSK